MPELLKINQTIITNKLNYKCEVKEFLGSGTQGEVYRVIINGKDFALKWFFSEFLKNDPQQEKRIELAIKKGPPNENFLWPIDITHSKEIPTFGYIMKLREKRFKGLSDLMQRKVEPTFHALTKACFELANSYLQLHSNGLCYRDISFGNVFLDPDTGEIRICDNDNVDIDKNKGSIMGTPRFMAPEIVTGKAPPSIQTDLFSLAVLLFYILMMHHPLEGKSELEIHCFDLPAMRKLYGDSAVFIFDPDDDSNRPVQGIQDNALIFWPIYPNYLKNMFINAFTKGLKDPNSRVRESEWRSAMIKLYDSIFYCSKCGAENFYNVDELKTQGKLKPCWKCGYETQKVPRIKIEDQLVILNFDTKLYFHHIDDQKLYDFSKPIAEVIKHPQKQNIWGLKNLCNNKWTVTFSDGSLKDINPNQSVTLSIGIKINFGKKVGEIRI